MVTDLARTQPPTLLPSTTSASPTPQPAPKKFLILRSTFQPKRFIYRAPGSHQHTMLSHFLHPGADPATIEQGPKGEVYIPRGGVTIGSTADQVVTSRPPFPSPYPPQSLPGGDGTPSTKVCPPGRAHYESSEGVLRDGSACFDGPRYRPVVSAAWTRGEVLPSISGVLCD